MLGFKISRISLLSLQPIEDLECINGYIRRIEYTRLQHLAIEDKTLRDGKTGHSPYLTTHDAALGSDYYKQIAAARGLRVSE